MQPRPKMTVFVSFTVSDEIIILRLMDSINDMRRERDLASLYHSKFASDKALLNAKILQLEMQITEAEKHYKKVIGDLEHRIEILQNERNKEEINIDIVAAPPKTIFSLRETAKQHHKMQSALHGDLYHASTDAERYSIAQKIMEQVEIIDKLYKRIAAIERGEVEELELSESFVKGVQTIRKQKSLKVSIRALKKRYQATNEDSILQRIEAKEHELSKIENILKYV